MDEQPYATRFRLAGRVRNAPRDPEARLAFAAFLRANGRVEAAEEQERKARQCKRFNPDYNYKAKLQKYGLRVTTFVHGELVRLEDGPYEYWAAPDELQEYLDTVPEVDWEARFMPIDEFGPSIGVLEMLADPKKVPGRLFDHEGSKLKQLPDDSWLLIEKNQPPVFFTAAQAKQYGFRTEKLQEIK